MFEMSAAAEVTAGTGSSISSGSRPFINYSDCVYRVDKTISERVIATRIP